MHLERAGSCGTGRGIREHRPPPGAAAGSEAEPGQPGLRHTRHGPHDKVTVPGAAYTGLAIATTKQGDRLFAADFAKGTVDVFDSAFKQVKTAPSQFRDARLPSGYLPFNTKALNGNIFVTYDKADPADGREAVGAGLGVVDEFSTDGHLISRIASGGTLNAPWGLAIAPSSWGSAAGSLLVGNFGDGRINILAKQGGHFAPRVTGQVQDASTGKLFTEPGLWSLLPRHRDNRRHRRALVHRGPQRRAERSARRPAPIAPRTRQGRPVDTGRACAHSPPFRLSCCFISHGFSSVPVSFHLLAELRKNWRKPLEPIGR